MANCLELNADETKCIKCRAGYTFITRLCILNIANCIEMNDYDACKICEDGY